MEMVKYEFLALLAVNALVAIMSVPLILGRIPRNRFYGFRLPKTLASDAVWYPANRMSGIAMVAAALFGMLAALLSKFLGVAIGEGQYMVFFCVLPLLAAVGYSFWGLRRIPIGEGASNDEQS